MRFVPLFALLALAIPAAAQSADPQEKPRKTCRKEASNTGSIMPGKRVCHTKEEWAQIDRAAALTKDNRQRTDGSTPLRPDTL